MGKLAMILVENKRIRDALTEAIQSLSLPHSTRPLTSTIIAKLVNATKDEYIPAPTKRKSQLPKELKVYTNKRIKELEEVLGYYATYETYQRVCIKKSLFEKFEPSEYGPPPINTDRGNKARLALAKKVKT